MLSVLQRWAQAQPDRIAIEQGAQRISYRALWEAILQCSQQLAAMNARTVAIALPDGVEWVVAHFACMQAAIPQVPLPPFFTPAQRLHALRDAGADVLLADRGIQSLGHAPVVLPPQTLLITYTSGSTGTPKGVCLSIDGMTRVAESLVAMLGAETAQRHLSVLPLAVLLEQIGGLYTSLLAGGSYVFAGLQTQPLLLASALAQQRATSCILVPELLKLLLASPRSQLDFSALKFVAVGGARVAEDLLHRAAVAGLPVYEGYGLTESASVVAVNTPLAHRAGTVGKLLPHIRAELAADGEIILNDPAILGYTDGAPWVGAYATGDIGSFDTDGYLRISGRKKNLLITAMGRNISPEWPESLLNAQPEIAQAMVYGDAQALLSALIVSSGGDVGAAVQRVNAQLPDYARIAHWQCVAPFTAASGLLTGNGRLRRTAILNHYHPKGSPDEFLRSARA